jgi:hypothetical protein
VIFFPWVTEKNIVAAPGAYFGRENVQLSPDLHRILCLGNSSIEPPIFTNINIRNMVVNQWIDMDKHDDKHGYVQTNTHVQPPKFTISRKMKNNN